MNESYIEDCNSPLTKDRGSDPQPFSESLEKGDGYVIFSSSEGPEQGGTKIVLKWGGNPQRDKQQKDGENGGKDQDKSKEKGDRGEKTEKIGGESEQDQGGKEGADSRGTGGNERSKQDGKEKGTQSGQKGGVGKGKDKGEGGEETEGDGKGEEEGGETEGGGKGGEKEGKEKDGEKGKGQGGKGQGEQGGDVGDEDEGDESDGGDGRGGLDPDKVRGQDILGRRRNRGDEPDDGEDGEPRRPPHGPRKKDKGRGKDKDRSSDKSRRPGEPGEPTDSGGDDTVMEVSSDITNVPPASEVRDPEVLEIIFDKGKKEVRQKENKVIHKSFVYSSGRESIQVFQITPKGTFSVGGGTYIRKLSNLVYYLYEPFLKAPDVDLDPSSPVIDSPISSRGLRSGRPYERPRISYGALSTLNKVDFSKLIVFIDVSGSMDMVMVSRVINSYFQSVFTALRKSSRRVKVLVVLHGTNAGVFGINREWKIAAQTIAGVAESSRDLVGTINGSESTLTHRIVDILREVSPKQEIGNIDIFINGQVPLIWITDFYWVINPGNQLTQFLRQKPALLISTVGDPEDVARGLGNKADKTFSGGAFGTARTIMNKVPYGALIYFPSFVGASSGSFTPGSSSGGSTVRVYAKGGAYGQLLSRKDKLGQVSIVRIR